jgi:hypothetical protein
LHTRAPGVKRFVDVGPFGQKAAADVVMPTSLTVAPWGRLLDGELLAVSRRIDWPLLLRRTFGVEETFRDQKDMRFGLGLSATHIRDGKRRDRLLLLAAVAQVLLTLLGAASEEAGLDRYLKVNTVKRRTHSLYRQGLYWYDCIPTMREDWLARLMMAFDRIVREHTVLREIFGII